MGKLRENWCDGFWLLVVRHIKRFTICLSCPLTRRYSTTKRSQVIDLHVIRICGCVIVCFYVAFYVIIFYYAIVRVNACVFRITTACQFDVMFMSLSANVNVLINAVFD